MKIGMHSPKHKPHAFAPGWEVAHYVQEEVLDLIPIKDGDRKNRKAVND